MNKRISRRDLLKTGLAAGVTSLVPLDSHAASRPDGPAEAKMLDAGSLTFAAADEGSILPLTCTSGVYIPPRGQSFFKFSYDFPEPSLTFQGMQFSFRLSTFENAYGLDLDSMKIERTADGLQLHCSQLVWAGGQQKASGNLLAQFRKIDGGVEWSASAEMDKPIKSITAIVRGVPRGKVAGGSG